MFKMSLKVHQLLLIFIFGAVLFFVDLDATYPDLMEARNLTSAREMITHDNWWNTTLNLQPRLEKPPLPTWLTAIVIQFFGQQDLTLLRLPSALCGILLCCFFYLSIKNLFQNKQLAFIATVILQSSYLMIQMARVNSWDIYTHAFMMGGLYFLIRMLQSKSILNAFGLILCFVLSIYSKGPVSPYALFLPFLIALYFSKYKAELSDKKYALISSIILGLFIGFSWYMSMYLINSDQAMRIVDKETIAWTTKHIRPFYYYLHFPIFCGIWCIPFVVSLFSKKIRNYANGIGDFKFTLIWLLGTLFLLSIIPTKKDRYLLPLLIPMALTTAYGVHFFINKMKEVGLKGFGKLLKYYFSFLFIALPLVGIYFHTIYFENSGIIQHFFILIMLVVGIVGCLKIYKQQYGHSMYWMLLLVASFMLSSFKNGVFYLEDYDDFIGVDTLQNTDAFQKNKFYAENNEMDPRLVWLSGKAIQKLDLENSSEWPDSFVFFTYWDMSEYLKKYGDQKFNVKFIGKYHTVRRKVEWMAHVYLVEKK